MRRLKIKFGFALIAALSAVAPGSDAETVQVIVPAPVTVAALPEGTIVRPVALTRMAGDLPAGKVWAEVAENPLCIPEYTLTWESKDNAINIGEAFDRVFRDELSKAGFKTAGVPTDLFVTGPATSDLQVGALVKDVRARFCALATGGSYKGSLVMAVEWQVYSVTRGSIVARISTEGGLQARQAIRDGIPKLIVGGFADNVRRLAANEVFRRLVTSGEVANDHQTSSRPRLRIKTPPASRQMALSEATEGVVTIFAGEGMGSGVLVSPDGYLLTNAHVADEGARVRVRWASGEEVIGEVVRADRRRDVALVRVSPPKAPAVPIRHTPAQLGETVYAIGTPREKEFSGTLTRGVVSRADRLLEGQPFIQSDVAVTHGNSGGPLVDENGWIVGLAALVYEPGGVGQNINFFIPIDDALMALGVEPGSMLPP